MSKYNIELSQQNNGWSAAITRRVTARKTAISKQQDGFSSEADAKAWAEEQLASYLQSQKARNARRS